MLKDVCLLKYVEILHLFASESFHLSGCKRAADRFTALEHPKHPKHPKQFWTVDVLIPEIPAVLRTLGPWLVEHACFKRAVLGLHLNHLIDIQYIHVYYTMTMFLCL